jgi:hypothetical protein
MRSPRSLVLGALVGVALLAGGAAALSRPAPPTPMTVYLTPT